MLVFAKEVFTATVEPVLLLSTKDDSMSMLEQIHKLPPLPLHPKINGENFKNLKNASVRPALLPVERA